MAGSNGAGRKKYSVIGKAARKVDAVSKITGQAVYADDMKLPRMLYCKILRSSVPHANIVRIDTSKAEALKGVKAVITGKDLPITYGMLPVSQDEHALALHKVRMVGDPVAAVAALDEDIATEALDLIEVEYEALPSISSIEEALDKPEARIHDYTDFGNVHRRQSFEFGNVEEGFKESDFVREDLTFYEGNTHLALEEHCSVANFLDAKFTIWSSTQDPHYLHRALARTLDYSAANIRVIATPCGGGFGGKCDPFAHEIIVCKLAQITGRPVKITLTREEVFYCHRGRHPVLMATKTGYNKDGYIVSMYHRTFLDGGAYGGHGAASTLYTGVLMPTTYKMGNYKFDAVRVFTNKAACGPKRGHGTPQGRYAQEVQMDKIAEQLGLDPAEMRKRHSVEPNSLTPNWLRIGTIKMNECIDKVVEGSGWNNKFRKLPHGKGIGIACSAYMTGAGTAIYWNNLPHSGVQLKLDRSGLVTVFCGSADIGQGSNSVLASIVAELFGIDPFEIRVVTGDTDLTPVDLGSYSSRVTLMTGNACVQAVDRAKALISEAVGEKLDVPKERIEYSGGRVFDGENPDKGMSWVDAVWAAETKFGTLGSTGSYKPPVWPGKFKGAGVGPSPCYSYCACVVETDVDPNTGIITLEKIWIAHDGGQSINPVQVMGQVEGSIYMGLSEALYEEMTYRGNRNVVHKFPSFLEYKSPTVYEMPDVITYLIEEPDPAGPFGAKEAGQGPLLPVPPAIANAVYDAVGVRIDEVPITPDKILKALKAKASGKEGRFGPTRFPHCEMPEPLVVQTPEKGGSGRSVDQELAGARK